MLKMIWYGQLVQTLTEDSLVMPGVPLAVMLPLEGVPLAVTLLEGDGDGEHLPVVVPKDVAPAEKETLPINKKAGQYCGEQSACMHGHSLDSLTLLYQLWY